MRRRLRLKEEDQLLIYRNDTKKKKNKKRRPESPPELSASVVGLFNLSGPAAVIARIVSWVIVGLMALGVLIVVLAWILTAWASPDELTVFVTSLR